MLEGWMRIWDGVRHLARYRSAGGIGALGPAWVHRAGQIEDLL
jgi:hypothetical protein